MPSGVQNTFEMWKVQSSQLHKIHSYNTYLSIATERADINIVLQNITDCKNRQQIIMTDLQKRDIVKIQATT